MKASQKKQEIVKCFTGSLPSGKGSDEETYARLGNALDVRAWLTATLAAERIIRDSFQNCSTLVIRGGLWGTLL